MAKTIITYTTGSNLNTSTVTVTDTGLVKVVKEDILKSKTTTKKFSIAEEIAHQYARTLLRPGIIEQPKNDELVMGGGFVDVTVNYQGLRRSMSCSARYVKTPTRRALGALTAYLIN